MRKKGIGIMKKCVGCNKTYDDTWKVCLLCREPLVELGQADSKTEQPHTPQAGAKEKRPVGIKVLAVLFIFSGTSYTPCSDSSDVMDLICGLRIDIRNSVRIPQDILLL